MQDRSSHLIISAVPAKPESTADYPIFDNDKESLIVECVNNLCSFDGGGRSPAEARQIASDVSKYLAYNNNISCKWEALLDISSMRVYVNKLEANKIGVNVISNKLNCLHMAFRYATRTKKLIPTMLYIV